MNWDAFEPEVIKAIGDFLAKVPRSVVLLRMDAHGQILECNPAFAELFPKGKFDHPISVASVLEACQERSGCPLPTALTHYRILGSLLPNASLRALHIPTRHGSVILGERMLSSSAEDLAMLTAATNEMARRHREAQKNYREVKRAQAQLEARHKLLVSNTDQGMVLFDLKGNVLEANPGAHRILGIDRAEEIQACLLDACEEDGSPLARESHPVIHALRTGQSRLGVVLGLKGNTLWILLDAMPEPGAGKVSRVCATFSDITDRTRSQETFLALTQRLQLATASAKLGVWDWDLSTGAMSWDERMLEIYGLSREALSCDVNDWKKSLHPEDLDRALAECEAALRGEAAYDTEFRICRPDGTVLWIKANAHIIRDQKGNARRMIGLNQDITEKKQADAERQKLQAQLLQSQKMESLGLLAGGVAHDMNNVLGAILGLASAHLEHLPEGSPLHHALGTICKAAERGGQMVKGLLSFAHQNSAEFRRLDLNALIQEEKTLLERVTLARVSTRLDLDPGLHPVMGDASTLAHAIINLCVNAVDAMPEKGVLSLKTRNEGPGWVALIVEDTGVGMSREVLQKAIEPFFTTKEQGKGTGLGLSMVFGTVKAHHGRMDIQSEPGKGTRVTIQIPALPGIEASPLEATCGAKGTQKRLDILVVDDDELIQQSAQLLLESLGHRVQAALRGEEALEKLSAGLLPDLVIMDMNMPGMGGAEALKRLRELHYKVPVLLSTGRMDESVLALAARYADVAILSKPFGVKEMKEKLKEMLGQGA